MPDPDYPIIAYEIINQHKDIQQQIENWLIKWRVWDDNLSDKQNIDSFVSLSSDDLKNKTGEELENLKRTQIKNKMEFLQYQLKTYDGTKLTVIVSDPNNLSLS